MNLFIKPLTPELLDDYLWFFDNRAFCDHPEWAACYCTFYTFKCSLNDWENHSSQQNRSKAEEQIKSGDLKGFLAFDDKVPIGFCNVNAKKNLCFDKYRTEINTTGTDGIVSVVCFVIDHKYRRRGVSTALLNEAINYYKESEYQVMESYPETSTLEQTANYHGYSSLFEKQGFKIVNELEKYEIRQLDFSTKCKD